MALLTIGAFAEASQLTPKALRLYDELGLLPPAAVDPDSGYRLYDPDQLEWARLIAQLRRIGMPLDAVRTVCSLQPTAAADAVAAYWRQVTADTAERGHLVSLLVERLSRREPFMINPDPRLEMRCAAGCETGAVRESNQDAVYASQRLLAVADCGGGPRRPCSSARGRGNPHHIDGDPVPRLPAGACPCRRHPGLPAARR